MFILGIDPGTIKCGYAIVKTDNRKQILVEAGFIEFKQKTLQEKMIYLNLQLDKIFNSFDIDQVAIEDIFYAHNPKTVIKLAQFRGALSFKILLSIGDHEEYTALQVKKAITGNGKATKEQVAFMVKRLLKIKKEIKPLDITDAMAIAITHAQRVKFSGVLESR
jgi:crossover junction endodeoxyribonuclease RuvC